MQKATVFLFLLIAFGVKGQNKVTGTEKIITKLVEKWNSYHITLDFEALQTLYTDKVLLYSNNCSKNQLIENKKSFIKKYPDFSQKIDMQSFYFKEIHKTKCKAIFSKVTVFNGKKSEVQAILEFKKINNDWKINYESDNVTEDNKPTKCITVVFKILESSPEYIKITNGLSDRIIKNGGTSYGYRIEGSPNPKEDEAEQYAAKYEFSLHETYPDRAPVIARYAFDPVKKKLFQYDAPEGEFSIPLSFEKKWLKKFEEICK